MIIKPHSEPVKLRIKRGMVLADINGIHSLPKSSLPKLSDINSPFQLAEYLALKVLHNPHDVKALVEVPTIDEGSSKTRGSERDLWIYEHLRRIPIDLTALITLLLPDCNAQDCPQMKAGEWQYLCVAHGSEGAEDCSAIDYILHTLDSTTTLLNSSEIFPSRLQIPPSSLAHFPSLFRRLSRIFSHAYFHHREAFSLAEAETSLYARFVALCEKFSLVGQNLLVIPPEALDNNNTGERDEDDSREAEAEPDIDSDSSSEDEDESLAGDTTSRGREKESESSGRRPHSLDRHARPHQFDKLRANTETQSSASTQSQSHSHPSGHTQQRTRGWSPADLPAATKGSPTTATSTSNPTFDPEPMANPAIGSLRDRSGQGMTLGRGTLGRKGRGTMLWSSDNEVPPPLPEKVAAPPVATRNAETSNIQEEEEPSRTYLYGAELTRSGSSHSTDTTIFIPHQDEQGHISVTSSMVQPTSEHQEVPVPEKADLQVPKDEIELLTEEGKLNDDSMKSSPAVEGGPDVKADSGASTASSGDEDVLEEVDLGEQNLHQEVPHGVATSETATPATNDTIADDSHDSKILGQSDVPSGDKDGDVDSNVESLTESIPNNLESAMNEPDAEAKVTTVPAPEADAEVEAEVEADAEGEVEVEAEGDSSEETKIENEMSSSTGSKKKKKNKGKKHN